MAGNAVNCAINIEPEETLTVSQYQFSGPHIVIEAQAGGGLEVNVAGGGAGIDGQAMLEWFKRTVRQLDEALTARSG